MKNQIRTSQDTAATPPTTPPAIAPGLTDEDGLMVLESFVGRIVADVPVELDVGVCENVVGVDMTAEDMVEVGVATRRYPSATNSSPWILKGKYHLRKAVDPSDTISNCFVPEASSETY